MPQPLAVRPPHSISIQCFDRPSVAGRAARMTIVTATVILGTGTAHDMGAANRSPHIGIRRVGGEHEQREDAKDRFHVSLLWLRVTTQSPASQIPASRHDEAVSNNAEAAFKFQSSNRQRVAPADWDR